MGARNIVSWLLCIDDLVAMTQLVNDKRFSLPEPDTALQLHLFIPQLQMESLYDFFDSRICHLSSSHQLWDTHYFTFQQLATESVTHL